jgi:predicted metalloprotease with PDZ domain
MFENTPLHRAPRGKVSTATTFAFLLVTFISWLPGSGKAAQPIHYFVDLTSTDSHLLKVSLSIPDALPGTEIQIPTWNALYQIRDFVKNVTGMKGECDGRAAELQRVDLNTWSGPQKNCANLEFQYSVYANEEGPFNSVLNDRHAFLNLAMVLFYLPEERQRAVQIDFRLPSGWKLATLLDGGGNGFQAENYDALVDSPVDAGQFEEHSYTAEYTPTAPAGGEVKRATVRVIIDANRDDYSSGKILDSLQKITAEEINLMQDLPFTRYTFILQFPRDDGSTGGMEHRNGTAISVPAGSIRNDEGYLDDVAAHEFFHLWNVKRIRPQTLEPVDYIHGNDTRDLWFCEGVTSTYAELAVLRAGLIDRRTFYTRVARAIQVLQTHNGRFNQSAETSGREAWLEGYSDYNRMDRSISYYNKGELLGYLLDLGIRHASENRAGLDDVMRRLNRDFAREGRFYAMADLQSIVRQLAPSFDIDRFLAEDVRGTVDPDFSAYLGYAGLNLKQTDKDLAVPGFTASRNAAAQMEVDSVDDGSGAARAGLHEGDILLAVNGEPIPQNGSDPWPKWRPGKSVELQIQRSNETQKLKFLVGVNQEVTFQIEQDTHPSADQMQVRNGWLKGETAAPGVR